MAGKEALHLVEGERPPGGAAANDLTIEQLAAETGMSVRNIRAHQARGLLGPPEVRQRTGFYGREHVARLRLIQELQGDGFNLRGIKRLLEDRAGESSEPMLSFRRAVTAPFETEEPEIITVSELRERFGEANVKNIARAVKLGMLSPISPTSFEVPSPSLLRIAEDVISRGVPMQAALDVVETVQRSSRYTAEAFAQLFLKWIWQPFDEAGQPPERWPEVLDSIEQLRPIASEVLVSIFKITMSGEVEEQFGKEMRRVARERR